MAKDDFDVIVFKILTYLYAVLKNKEIFTQKKYDIAIGKKNIDENYLNRIYKMMADEGYIEKVSFTKTWGNIFIPLFTEDELMITATGIHYLEENDKMKNAGRYLMEKTDVIVNVAITAGLEFLFNR